VSRQCASSIELTINFDINYTCTSKGCPEQGPTFASGGQPAEPPEFDYQVYWNSHDITHMLSDFQKVEVEQLIADDYAGEEQEHDDDGGDAE
jgi:hypothetical protein